MEKQTALQQQKELVLATLDYLTEHFTGGIVLDGWDPVAAHYEQERMQAEKYFQEHLSDKLQQQLRQLTQGLRNRRDLKFSSYIKEKTGYDLDIFSLGSRVDHKTSQSNKNEYTEIIKREKKDGVEMVTLRTSTGPKPAHLRETEEMSPDGKRRLRVVEWSDGKHASTYVEIMFKTANGSLYGANGIRPDIRAYWKDNHTIVIDTNKAYLANIRRKQVQSYDDVINIEYIEH